MMINMWRFWADVDGGMGMALGGPGGRAGGHGGVLEGRSGDSGSEPTLGYTRTGVEEEIWG
jgi:hypothetical protein